eukprot:TRINITY_DN36288_c0_g1_i1.p1 TRINITY_DN36288_c0_g1~~TRINITY_DN36288_c0_g1_i1.p1  ORF type:complete len:304 (+),score=44.21 TRINITY_DN36288_c0_g1_i1:68-913(+)
MPHKTRTIADESKEVENPTSLMVKNIPCRFAQEDVLEAINGLGFENDYDFFYMPMRPPFTKPHSYGYAFINFVTSEKARLFERTLEEGQIVLRKSSKPLAVALAHLQGKDSLSSHFKGTCVAKAAWGPKFEGDAGADDGAAASKKTRKASSKKTCQQQEAASLAPGKADSLQCEYSLGQSLGYLQRLAAKSEQFSPLSAACSTRTSISLSTGWSSDSDASERDVDGLAGMKPPGIFSTVPQFPLLAPAPPIYGGVSTSRLGLSDPLYIPVDTAYFSDCYTA